MTSPHATGLSIVGDNATPIWGMTNAERLRRMAAQAGLAVVRDGEDGATLIANAAYAIDPAWLRHLLRHPDTVLTLDGAPVLAHAGPQVAGDAVAQAMRAGEVWRGPGALAAERPEGIYDDALRKRERPFALPLTPATVPAVERASYKGAYKGVTDLLTLYLWPTWAFHLTRIAARIGLSPNGVTAIGTLLCVAATILFWHGLFWSGLLLGLVFMVLDTVDGKLARCTITSSKLGNAWDHGIDLVHPPIWWWAWGVGCAAYGRPLSDPVFWGVMATMLVGYVAQRLIEGAFIVRFGMHIHVWERFDSRFRLVTARRNPNMVILFASLLVARPDAGIVAVAAWTAASLLVHLVRLGQAILRRARGQAIVSWLA